MGHQKTVEKLKIEAILQLPNDLMKTRSYAIFMTQMEKVHEISSDFYGMRKILRKKFWSQGTALGSLGPGSQEALGLGPCRFQILVIWGPYEASVLVACLCQAKIWLPGILLTYINVMQKFKGIT